MKISDEQRNAASLYWTKILTGELNPKPLVASKQCLPPFMAKMEAMNRRGNLEKLARENPTWTFNFMTNLDSLLKEADESIELCLDYQPRGILKQAANEAGIPEDLFPAGKLSMTFDNEGHIIVGNEKIDANNFIESVAQKITSSFQ